MEGEGGKMWEQLASRRGMREQRRICLSSKPAATDESLYKQPTKPSAQVGTVSPQTIWHRFTNLPGDAAQTIVGCGFSVIKCKSETHDGSMDKVSTNTVSLRTVSISAGK